MSTAPLGYSETVREHVTNPRNMGELQAANGVGRDENPVCGDVMTVWIRVEDEKISELSFVVRGCDPSIAAGSIMTEIVKGLSVTEAAALKPEQVSEALGGLPPVKRHCSFLAVRAFEKALADFARETY